MNKLKINIVLPFPVTKPVGGAKIMYEYAQRLNERGHDVTIYHAIVRPFKKSKSPVWLKSLIYKLRRVERPGWFPLSERIRSVIVPSITNRYIRDADITMSTWWQMTWAVHELSAEKGKKFNLIQDYEVWGGQKDKVEESYSLPVNHMVIARYLQELVSQHSSSPPLYLPNAIDTDKFFTETDPSTRSDHSVVMMYSEEPRKGSAYGLKALMDLQLRYPDLSVQLFGVYEKPAALPGWITYSRKPGNLRELYNKCAIFFSPSNGEGWALPPAEAMACSCAVVCTDIGGHHDYAIDGETALLVQPKNVDDMVDKLSKVISNRKLRLALAQQGQFMMLSQFNWNKSVEKMEYYFYTL